uniref:Type III restriction enzyme n=1 Tax=Candidatus Kentrum sp. FW TaxID=2126338 RepID=A0A450S438_9GAMM|nr:MAG: type III restriction enzyme [Candidatus Kentron sp. FW]
MPLHPNFPTSPHAIVDPAARVLFETFRKAVNASTVRDASTVAIDSVIRLRQTRPFVVREQGYLVPKKSVFNRIIGDGGFELKFAQFLENCRDVVAYAKNYLAVGFRLDYVNSHGNITNYYPDFLVKLTDGRVVIVETKGREELELPRNIERLRQWCEDVNRAQSAVWYGFVYVDQAGFEKYRPKALL